MNIRARIVYALAGLLAGVSGFISASAVSLPHTFTAGTAAVAADVNANFTALANAINALDTRVAGLENFGLKSGTPVVVVTQTPAAPGTQINIGGNIHTIERIKAPAFASDTSVVIDTPDGGSVEVGRPGAFDFEDLTSSTFVTTLSGRTVACTDSIYYYGASNDQHFSQSLSCKIILDAESWVRLDWELPDITAGASSTPPDNSSIDPYSVVPTAAQRNTRRDSLRSLLKYVVIS